MSRRALLLMALIAPALGYAQSADRTYQASRAADTQPDLRMIQVSGQGSRTVIDFVYTTSRDITRTGIGVFPPGHNMAFFAVDPATQKKYALVDIQGIAVRPSGNLMTLGESRRFRLVFERIPTNHFHLVEGTTVVEGQRSWNFMNVKIE